jgi:hypothetical protein
MRLESITRAQGNDGILQSWHALSGLVRSVLCSDNPIILTQYASDYLCVIKTLQK